MVHCNFGSYNQKYTFLCFGQKNFTQKLEEKKWLTFHFFQKLRTLNIETHFV